MHFRTLLLLAIIVPLFLTGSAVIVTMYFNAEHRSTDMAEKLLAAVTARAGQEVHARSVDAVNVAHAVAALAEDGLDLNDSDRLVKQQLGILRANPGITWISYSDTAGSFTGAYRDSQGRTCTNQSHISGGKTALIEYVVDADDQRTVLRREEDSGYDPRTRDFYIQAAKQRDVVWLPPYVFFGQPTAGITCALAVRAAGGEVRGVISVDYDLKTLSSFARQVVASKHSQVMVFTSQRVLVAHSGAKIVDDSSGKDAQKLLTMADVRDPVTEAFQRNLPTAALASGERGGAGGAGSQFIRFVYQGAAYLACVVPVQLESGPSEFVATVAPVHDFAPTAWQSSKGAILIVVTALVLATGMAMALAYGMGRPIDALVGVSEQIGKGDLNVKIHLGPLHEFKRLATAFDLMLANLRDWVRVRTSLQLAMEIQRNLLPAGPPRVAGFDIAGYSAYCDETGGDYYDYILVDPAAPSQLLVALGDVMGHGLPSALMMAGARGILRSSASDCIDPGELLTRLNALLYQDTGGKRFMTMVLVSFDTKGCNSRWASAGHDPPIIFDPGSKTFEEPEGGDVPLGIMDEVEYGDCALESFHKGQVIFIGSDGVWETFAPGGDQYGKERVKEVLLAHGGESAEAIKNALLASLTAFRSTAPAKDDVTFIIIKISGGEGTGAV